MPGAVPVSPHGGRSHWGAFGAFGLLGFETPSCGTFLCPDETWWDVGLLGAPNHSGEGLGQRKIIRPKNAVARCREHELNWLHLSTLPGQYALL